MPNTTNNPVSSYDEGPKERTSTDYPVSPGTAAPQRPEPKTTNTDYRKAPAPKKVRTEDQGPEQKVANKNPNRENAADRVETFLEDAKTDPAAMDALAQHKATIPDRSNVSPSDDAANIPVSEVAAGIEPPEFSQGPDVKETRADVDPSIAFGDPDSIAAWERRHAEEAKLRGGKTKE